MTFRTGGDVAKQLHHLLHFFIHLHGVLYGLKLVQQGPECRRTVSPDFFAELSERKRKRRAAEGFRMGTDKEDRVLKLQKTDHDSQISLDVRSAVRQQDLQNLYLICGIQGVKSLYGILFLFFHCPILFPLQKFYVGEGSTRTETGICLHYMAVPRRQKAPRQPSGVRRHYRKRQICLPFPAKTVIWSSAAESVSVSAAAQQNQDPDPVSASVSGIAASASASVTHAKTVSVSTAAAQQDQDPDPASASVIGRRTAAAVVRGTAASAAARR